MIDFNSLKAEFLIYLENNNEKIKEKSKNEEINANNISIFNYSEDFANYLKEEYNFDWSNSMSGLQKLLSDYVIVNGEIKEKDELSNDDIAILQELQNQQEVQANASEVDDSEETQDQPLINETVDPAEPVNADGTQNTILSVTGEGLQNLAQENEIEITEVEFMAEALNDMLKDKNFKDAIINLQDKDGDGKLSDEEFSDFLKILSSYDEKEGNLSLEDLIAAASDIEDGTFRSLTDDEITNAITENNKIDIPLSTSNGLAAPHSTVSAKDIELPIRDSSGNIVTENRTKQQLVNEQKNVQADYDKNKTQLDKVINDDIEINGQKASELKANRDEAGQDFEAAVKEADSELAARIKTKQDEIANKENEIKENENAITLANENISKQESIINKSNCQISDLDNTISSLESALNSCKEDEDKAPLNSKLEQAKSEKQEAQKALEEANKALQETQESLDECNKNKEKLQADLDKLNEELKALEEESKALEEQNPEIAAKREAYDNLKEEYNTYMSETKPSLIQQARQALSENQKELDILQKAIDERESKENARKLSPSSGAVEMAELFKDMSETQVEDTLRNEYGINTNLPDGLWCSAFVRQMMNLSNENLPDWYTNCNTNSCSEVYSAANNNGCAFSDANQAQVGDVIFFNTSRGNCRHTGIITKIDEDGTIHTIEGNSSSKVSERTYQAGTNKIFGFARVA